MGDLPSTPRLQRARWSHGPLHAHPLPLNQATRCLAVDQQCTPLARLISPQWLPAASGDSARGQTSPRRPSVRGTAPEESPEPLCLTFLSHTNPC